MISWVAYLSVGLVIGIGVGVYASRLDMFRSKKQLELEQKLHDTQEELSRYRKDVAQHFVETSSLVNTMTESYRAVFAHLANGAKTLCGDQVQAYRLDLPEKHLIGEAGEASPVAPSHDAEAASRAAAESIPSEDMATAEEAEPEVLAEADVEIETKQKVDFSDTTADDTSTIPVQAAGADVPSVQETQVSDDEHAAFLGEQDGPPVSAEESSKPGSDKPPTVH